MTRSSTAVLGTAVLAAFLAIVPVVAEAADIGQGAAVARRWCAACHLVSPDQQSPTTEAAPFASIAKRPGFDAGALALFLLDPHPKMPNMSLTRAEAADLAAYIQSLAK